MRSALVDNNQAFTVRRDYILSARMKNSSSLVFLAPSEELVECFVQRLWCG
jgi:hypothetical protein